MSSSLRLTKLTHTAVYTKPLQRQNVSLASQVFNEKKTVTGLKSWANWCKQRDGFVRQNYFRLVHNHEC